MRHPLPRSFYVIGLLSVMLLWGAHVIGRQQAIIDAIPLIEFNRVDARTEDVRRGPVKKTRVAVVAPDGTKTTTTTTDIGTIDSHKEARVEEARKETPVVVSQERARTRYVGAGVDPLDYARMPRLRAGVTLWGVVDVGVAYDARLAPTKGAFTLEATYRF